MFTLEKDIKWKMMLSSIQFSWIIKTNNQGGSSAGPKWRLRLQPNTSAPAPKPCVNQPQQEVAPLVNFLARKGL